MAKKKKQGHYCKICGGTKANEKFSGKGHAVHICKKCHSLPKDVQTKMMRDNRISYPVSLKEWIQLDKEQNTHNEKELEAIFDDGYIVNDYADLDNLPVFSEKKKFKELDSEYKALLREYIRREVSQYLTTCKKIPKENELIETRKQMIQLFEEEYNIILKRDPLLRQFFADNATAVINKRKKEMEDNK